MSVVWKLSFILRTQTYKIVSISKYPELNKHIYLVCVWLFSIFHFFWRGHNRPPSCYRKKHLSRQISCIITIFVDHTVPPRCMMLKKFHLFQLTWMEWRRKYPLETLTDNSKSQLQHITRLYCFQNEETYFFVAKMKTCSVAI